MTTPSITPASWWRFSLRVLSGVAGAILGWLIWSDLYAALGTQVGESTMADLASSDAWGTICGLCATGLVLGCGLGAQAITTWLTSIAAGEHPRQVRVSQLDTAVR